MKHLTKAALAAAALLAAGPGISTPAAAQDVYIGSIHQFGFNWCPRGYLAAAGQVMLIANNQALYSLIGTAYGGDGRTTFALPDLRGRTTIGTGPGPGLQPRVIGEKLGTEQATLTTLNLPAHSHSAILRAEDAAGTSDNPTNGLLADFPAGQNIYADGPANVSMSPEAIVIGQTGGGYPFSIMQPSLAVSSCIATEGLYPPRP